MAKVIVLGATGGFGLWMCRAFVATGWQVVAVCRKPEKAASIASEVQMVVGDIKDTACWADLLEPEDILVYAANPPYHHWATEAEVLLESALSVAELKRATVLFPGNVYGFDPVHNAEVCETDPQCPPTAKGAIRVRMEQRLQRSAERGVRVVVLRAGDFIFPKAGSNNWFTVLLKRSRGGLTFQSAGPVGVVHSWAYLPDFCATFERLAQVREALPSYCDFHFRGWVLNAEHMQHALTEASGLPVRLKLFSWWPLKIVAWFSPLVREVMAMRYLWEQPLVLNDDKLQAALQESGGVVSTPQTEALREVLAVDNA